MTIDQIAIAMLVLQIVLFSVYLWSLHRHRIGIIKECNKRRKMLKKILRSKNET